MHVGLQRFQLLLMTHTEMLLFVNDQQAEIGKFDALGKQRMGADDDVDVTGGKPAFHLGRILGIHHPRQLADLDRQAFETPGETSIMLACQKRCRHHNGYLRA